MRVSRGLQNSDMSTLDFRLSKLGFFKAHSVTRMIWSKLSCFFSDRLVYIFFHVQHWTWSRRFLTNWFPFSDSITLIAGLYSNRKAHSQLNCQNHLCISLIKPSEGRFQGIFPSLSYSNRTEGNRVHSGYAYFGTSLVRHRCVSGSSQNTQVSSKDNSQSNYNMQGVISVKKNSRIIFRHLRLILQWLCGLNTHRQQNKLIYENNKWPSSSISIPLTSLATESKPPT